VLNSYKAFAAAADFLQMVAVCGQIRLRIDISEPACGSTIKMYFLRLLPVCALAVVTCLVAACDRAQAPPSAARAEPIKVVSSRLEKQSLVDEIQALGTAGANESIQVRPRLASIVTRIAFEEDQYVNKGDLLVELENSEIRAGLAVAEAALSESRSLYNRSRSLAPTHAISASSLEQLQAAMHVNEAQVEAAKARLANTLIYAAFAGRIGLRRVSPGSFVDTSTTITTLDDTASIKLDFSIPETYLSVVTQGMNIVANSLVYPDQPFGGSVASIDTRLDPVTRSVQVRALLPNPDGLLKPGMFLTVRLQRDRGPVLVAPEAAIVPERGLQFVYRVIDGKAVMQQVELGRRAPGRVEIVSGVEEGDLLIVEGTHKVRDGSPVEIVRGQAAGPSSAAASGNL
jgi:membrane fusion protein (multidrug efflux system)